MSGNVNTKTNLLEVEPLRNLGFWELWAIGVGTIVGDGIFLLMSDAVATAGPSAALAFALAGFIELCIVLAMGELSIAMPTAGAMEDWVTKYLGGWWGYLTGFSFNLGWIIAGGSSSLALGRITCYFFPGIDLVWGTVGFALLFLSIFAILNIFGTLLAARTQLYMVMGVVAVMVVFVVIGAFKLDVQNYQPFFPKGWAGFTAAIPLGAYCFCGSATLATGGSEAKNTNVIIKALKWVPLTFIIVYTAAILIMIGCVDWTTVSMDVSMFTLAAEKLLGKNGGFIMNATAWLAAATCVLMGTVYACPRTFFWMARRGTMPKFFGYLHPKTRTPIWGICTIWAISSGLILISIINPDFVYVTCAMQLLLAWMITFTLAVIAGMAFRAKEPEKVKSLPWNQPLYPLLPIIAILGNGITAYYSFVSSPITLIIGAIWIVLLYIYYKFYVSKQTSYNPAENISG